MFSRPASQLRLVVAAAAAVLTTACAGLGHPPASRDEGPAARTARVPAAPGAVVRPRAAHEQAAVIAVRQVGVPYRYGGTSRGEGFDCSGLVYYAYQRAGRRVPRTTATLWEHLEPVSRRDMRVGDVLFFRIEGKMSHVGLYLGDGRFVHAPSSGREVTVAALETPFYRQAFIRAGRP